MATRVYICGIDTSKLPKLSAEDMQNLMQKLKKGDTDARQAFVVANLRLVLSIVHRFSARGEVSDDMFQVGCVGLMKAIDNFDTSLDVKFSTYAVPMIIGEIRRYLRDNCSLRVSRSLRDVACKALQTKEQLTATLSREPSLDEIALALQLPLSTVTFALDAISDTISLSQPIDVSDADAQSLVDQIADEKHCEENWEVDLSIKDAIKTLADREKEILLMRYYVGKTQMEVSRDIGISQAQVSRLEKSALKVLERFLTT